MGHIASDAYRKFRYQVIQFANEQLKLLLETKHLYQKVSLQSDAILAALTPVEPATTPLGHIGPSEKTEFEKLVLGFVSQSLKLGYELLYEDKPQQLIRCLVVSNVKLFCAKCDGREVFRPIWFTDVTNEMMESGREKASKAVIAASFYSLQLFVLVFQCQRCEDIPEAFFLKLEEMNLSIEGRSPIEHLEIHGTIPKKEAKWFRDALVAYQSGKTLAGLFYLRTFIEQFGRRLTGMLEMKETGDVILSAYAETLPPKVRDSAPSLRDCYDKLSEAIHGAKEDVELFEAIRAKIEKHFDFRKLYDGDDDVTRKKAEPLLSAHKAKGTPGVKKAR
jgi:hypothetical protein